MNERINVLDEIYRKSNSTSNYEKNENMKKGNPDVPLYLDIEITNCCNIACNMCPVGTGIMKRNRGFMSDEVFDKICENVEKYSIQAVRFIRWGEPTLHKNFLIYLEKMKKSGTIVHFNTNGILLTDEMMKKIIDLQIDSVKFSFQGIDQQTYSEMRSKGNYEQLVETIQRFYQLRGENLYPYISVTTSTTYESQKQIKSFEESIKPYCDRVSVGRTKMEHVDFEQMKITPERKLLYEKYIQEEKGIMKRMAVCPELWDKLSVNWDGSVSACCRDYDNMMLVGDITKDDLRTLFHNMQEEIYRTLVCNSEFDKLPLCKDCYEYIPLEK